MNEIAGHEPGCPGCWDVNDGVINYIRDHRLISDSLDAFNEEVADHIKTVTMMSRIIRSLVDFDGPDEDIEPFLAVLDQHLTNMDPGMRVAMVLDLCVRADDWTPTPPIKDPDFTDPGVQETFKKIDEFLTDPSTGVIRELPARRVKGEEG